MKKCLKILFRGEITDDLTKGIMKKARSMALEGDIQILDKDLIKIIAYGSKENIDKLVDMLYNFGSFNESFSVEIEPYLKDKDYRGIFRIVV